jgi:hypothetical protein
MIVENKIPTYLFVQCVYSTIFYQWEIYTHERSDSASFVISGVQFLAANVKSTISERKIKINQKETKFVTLIPKLIFIG